MEKREQMYEGKAKKVFATDNEDYCIVAYKDDATAFNGEKKGTIVGKGVVNNRMSNFMFKLLEAKGVPTDYVEELSDRETLLKKVEIVPLEVIIRNKAAGSFSKRFGVPEGTTLKCPTLEFCLKDDDLGFHGEILLADEISPDTCRFWDVDTQEKLDKDRFRRDMGGVEDAYAEMMKRVGLSD